MNTPVVYIVQRPFRDKDLSSANRYGALKFVIDDERLQSSARPGIASRLIEKGLADFRPDTDYLLHLGGDWAAAFMAGGILSRWFPGQEIKILRWERDRDLAGNRQEGLGFYTPSTIRL